KEGSNWGKKIEFNTRFENVFHNHKPLNEEV
ncbi:unnamed protein product, partial [marine sediment metagenome]